MKYVLYALLAITIALPSFAQAPFVFNNINIIAPGDGKPRHITAIGDELYMQAQMSPGVTEPWISDGTQAGTKALMIIDSFSGSFPSEFIQLDSIVIFEADGVPWITDGTRAGTHVVTPNYEPALPDYFTHFSGGLIFASQTFNEGVELWKTNGKASGTKLIKDIYIGSTSSAPNQFTPYAGRVFFSAGNDLGKELWVTDGTNLGTKLVKDICAGAIGSFPQSIRVFNSNLMFFATDGVNGTELYTSDGTTAGTQIIKDINPGPGSCINNIYPSVICNSNMYFIANDGVHGYELWMTDGTAPGMHLVYDIAPGTKSSLSLTSFAPVVYNNKVYFAADNDTLGYELWCTDGSKGGTQLVADIFTGTGSSSPTYFTVYKNKLYFSAYASNNNAQLFVTDGTTAGTKKLLPPSTTKNNPLSPSWFYGFTFFGRDSSLYFTANYDSTGIELWSVKDTTGSTIYNSGTGVTNVHLQNNFTLYPNPNDGTFTIQLENTDFKNGNVAVYDMFGREAYQSQITNSKSQITLDQPKGIYLVKLQLDDAVLTKWITVE